MGLIDVINKFKEFFSKAREDDLPKKYIIASGNQSLYYQFRGMQDSLADGAKAARVKLYEETERYKTLGKKPEETFVELIEFSVIRGRNKTEDCRETCVTYVITGKKPETLVKMEKGRETRKFSIDDILKRK